MARNELAGASMWCPVPIYTIFIDDIRSRHATVPDMHAFAGGLLRGRREREI
jgi:hypothetical protein